jgi:hypothetical protein
MRQNLGLEKSILILSSKKAGLEKPVLTFLKQTVVLVWPF